MTGLGLNVIHQMRYGQFCVDVKTYCIKLMWFDSCQKRSGWYFKKAALSAADFYVLVRMLDDFTVKDYLVVPHEDVSEFPNWIKDPWRHGLRHFLLACREDLVIRVLETAAGTWSKPRTTRVHLRVRAPRLELIAARPAAPRINRRDSW